ncbi:MAG: DUF6443 domain-containing protein, partial [Prevotellaceae bacterium]|nr:DUF6443 domain-containing protein [Prevotellaceae bacterium]
MKKYLITILMILSFYETILSQTNRIIERIFNDSTMIENITFYDSFGYPEQVIQIKGSPNMKNIVTPVFYDNMRRDNAKVYLPYV